MIDAQSQAILTDIVRREGRSLLTYVRDAFPWTTAAEEFAVERLQAIIREEEEATAAIGRFLVRNKWVLPYLGAYPMSFTTINFVSLRHLVPLLVDAERRTIADLEAKLKQIHDPAARVPVQELLNLKRKHVEMLQNLHEPAGPVATVH